MWSDKNDDKSVKQAELNIHSSANDKKRNAARKTIKSIPPLPHLTPAPFLRQTIPDAPIDPITHTIQFNETSLNSELKEIEKKLTQEISSLKQLVMKLQAEQTKSCKRIQILELAAKKSNDKIEKYQKMLTFSQRPSKIQTKKRKQQLHRSLDCEIFEVQREDESENTVVRKTNKSGLYSKRYTYNSCYNFEMFRF